MHHLNIKKFKEDGYLHFPFLVSEQSCNDALEIIDDDFHKNYKRKKEDEYQSISFCPNIRNTPELKNLFLKSPLHAFTTQCFGEDNFSYGLPQIALRPPNKTPNQHLPPAHIDGLPQKKNGVKGKEIEPFSLLIGIFLSDIPSQNSGNLTVWKGSHTRLEDHFQTHGKESLKRGMPNISLGTPKQLLCKKGDAILCHYQLAHAVAPNLSNNTRKAIYFRVSHKNVLKNRYHTLTHLWDGWRI